MRIFITWSDEPSKSIAEILCGWLPNVIQAIEPYFSPHEEKGTRWETEISNELDQCDFGICCMTANNLNAPWIHFEAGALSKKVKASNVCPLMFGPAISELKYPMAQFQVTQFNKKDVEILIKTINEKMPNPLTEKILLSAYERSWTEFESKVSKILKEFEFKTPTEPRSDSDLLKEILEIVRTVSRTENQDLSSNLREILEQIYKSHIRLMDKLMNIEKNINPVQITDIPKNLKPGALKELLEAIASRSELPEVKPQEWQSFVDSLTSISELPKGSIDDQLKSKPSS